MLANPEKHFPKIPLWKVLLFALATLGLYLLYWIYTRSYALNAWVGNTVPNILLNCFVGAYIILFVVGFYPNLLEEYRSVFFALNMFYIASVVIMTLCMKRGFENLLQTKLHLLWSLLFLVFYFQYKINSTPSQELKTKPTGDSGSVLF